MAHVRLIAVRVRAKANEARCGLDVTRHSSLIYKPRNGIVLEHSIRRKLSDAHAPDPCAPQNEMQITNSQMRITMPSDRLRPRPTAGDIIIVAVVVNFYNIHSTLLPH